MFQTNNIGRLLIFSFLSFCFILKAADVSISDKPLHYYKSHEWVDSVFNSLTLEERIGQLIMIPAYSNKSIDHVAEVKELIRKYKVGGVIAFQGGPGRQIHHINKYQAVSSTPLLVATDAEWGLAMRLDSTLRYPYQMTLGAIQNNNLIKEMGADIARQLKKVGVHVNFAPVCDINVNPANPVINYRSFGEDKDSVTAKSIAYMQGMQENNILATAKHFPGHGDTHQDSHKTLPIIPHSFERLNKQELVPFKKMIEKDVGCVMTAHLHIPALDSADQLAASLSPKIVQDILIDKLSFKGLTVTDALNMSGVSNYFNSGEIAVKSLIAGNDILLMPDDISRTIRKIEKAIKKGELNEESINESCKKVLAAKYWCGAHKFNKLRAKNIYDTLHRPRSKFLIRQLYKSALTVIKNNSQLIPVNQLKDRKIASVIINADEHNSFQYRMNYYANVDHYVLKQNAPIDSVQNVLSALKNYDCVIAGLHGLHRTPYNNFGITPQMTDFISKLALQNTLILDVFGNPYAMQYLSNIDNIEAIIISYEDVADVHDLSAQLIFGGIKANGELPVTAISSFPEGTGIKTQKTRMAYTMPEAFNLSRDTLLIIDSIANYAVTGKITPGCQILAAKNGEIFYNKTFGYHTYMKKNRVDDFDLYDIASITKIVATLPLLMKLHESGQIDIEEELSDYLPYLDTTNKKDMKISEILAHQAGLKPWIPFYFDAFEGLDYQERLISNQLSEKYPFKLDEHKFMNKNYRFKTGYFSYFPTDEYNVRVSDHLFVKESYKDSIYKMINDSELLEEKEYKYSDLGFYYFYDLIEGIKKQRFDSAINDFLYSPLGATHTTYLPLDKFASGQIIPTENDQIFRKDLIHGYVHDPGAALFGGVCGHAGVFSTANDLAKIMQMYLNNGYYGGERFFDEATLGLFTSSPFKENKNRRALGFDKPVVEEGKPGPTCKGICEDSYGHSGFTGTIAWADPEENLIFIFLSNRIHPDQYNRKLIEEDIRTKIQRLFYNAFPGKSICKDQKDKHSS
jgi:beta-glucosidase-like glycosyl hydrolase/CubicO group peptidase (beta-lactamase class C family)